MEYSWNPWHGCHKISDGCKYCYVYRMDCKYEKDSSTVTKTLQFDLPLKKDRNHNYKIPSGSFVDLCFTSDFFVEEADEWRKEIWNIIRERSDVKFFFITKRIDRFLVSLPEDWGNGWDNVIVGCTCENQSRADYRLPIFNSLPIKHKYIICGPLLENINLEKYLNENIEQVAASGESGENARICDYDWVLNIRNQCVKKNISFFFHQTGARLKKDSKIYRIPRGKQHSQAHKANIDYKINSNRI